MAAAPVDPTSPAAQSARGLIAATLANYGLGSLVDWAWGQYTGGAATEQIMLDIQQRPEFQQRFPAMAEMAKKGQAITPGQYVQFETTVTGIMRAAGMPSGFYDQPADFTKWLVGNVSASEIQQRVQNASAAIYSSPPEMRAQLDRLYGAGASPGQVAAFFLDPTRAEPLLAKEWSSAQAAGQAVTSGYGQLDQSQAEFIGSQGLAPGAISSGFAELGKESSVFQRQVGGNDDNGALQVSTHEQLAAAFGGDAKAQQHILSLFKQRQVDEQAGGTFDQARPGAGMTGIGVDPASL